MECVKCQSEIRPDFNFCPMCGQQIYSEVILPYVPYDKNDYPDGLDPKLYEIERPR
jgi:hypothetical protein